ncbi:MAG: bifunctional DNA-binding transcriptional regulator/O6-methylguanine-DNA methyltransferase Ada [Pseudomonadota bacterium]
MTPAAATNLTDTQRWTAVQTRDRAADGAFVYAVRTTGIYCRPSCPSRRALRANVSFHADAAAAERAGFRACKRCRPQAADSADRNATLVARLCRLIEQSETIPSLAQLAASASLSRFHLHRLFVAATGVTPRDYALTHRRRRVGESLSSGVRVTDAIYDAGYGSNSRFYAESSAALGMTPTRFRSGGVATTIRFALAECSLGSILVAATDQGVCAILLGDDPELLLRDLQDRFPKAELLGGEKSFDRLVAQAIALVETPGKGHRLPLDVRGTAFQQRVWKQLQAIPPGRTASYADVARKLKAPRSVRAVAQACGANPVAVAIPCHRVVRSDGALSGYRWGIERKRELLRREAGE